MNKEAKVALLRALQSLRAAYEEINEYGLDEIHILAVQKTSDIFLGLPNLDEETLFRFDLVLRAFREHIRLFELVSNSSKIFKENLNSVWSKLGADRECDPVNGGCWFCRIKDDSLVFDTEWDTYVHLQCIRDVLDENPTHREATSMIYLLDGGY